MQPTDPTKPQLREYRGTLRVDEEPGGKKFQGVWLEHGGEKRWVIAYRPSPLWRAFAEQEVIVIGHCFQPFGQAINAPHFRIATLRYAAPPGRISVPYLGMGPEQWITGSFSTMTFPAGSKRAGDREQRFVDEHGTSYHVAGLDQEPPNGPATIHERVLERNMAYTASTGGNDVWVIEVHPRGYTAPVSRDTPIDCP